ncbi:hypothetical protein HELRODRAFT_79613, partial [Helobdella robusta]|uniref:Reverse transcriptase domain-containing protein n=1 Tax=Helobdella robusta TaxID=6412 RepID=T1G3Q8_HELRO
NDLTMNVRNNCKLYADDTKIIKLLENNKIKTNLQNDLNEMFNWSDKWYGKFNTEKYKIKPIAWNNSSFVYYIKNKLNETELEKDLVICVSNNLKWMEHVCYAVGKANRKLSMTRKSFLFPDEKSLKLLYTSLVRLHLEYAATVWNPYLTGEKKS